jgi:hypothetical protein
MEQNMQTEAEVTEAFADKIGEQAQLWIRASYDDPDGRRYPYSYSGRFTFENMETAYCAGFSAGLEHARNLMAKA